MKDFEKIIDLINTLGKEAWLGEYVKKTKKMTVNELLETINSETVSYGDFQASTVIVDELVQALATKLEAFKYVQKVDKERKQDEDK
jgi:hypothetical protein